MKDGNTFLAGCALCCGFLCWSSWQWQLDRPVIASAQNEIDSEAEDGSLIEDGEEHDVEAVPADGAIELDQAARNQPQSLPDSLSDQTVPQRRDSPIPPRPDSAMQHLEAIRGTPRFNEFSVDEPNFDNSYELRMAQQELLEAKADYDADQARYRAAQRHAGQMAGRMGAMGLPPVQVSPPNQYLLQRYQNAQHRYQSLGGR